MSYLVVTRSASERGELITLISNALSWVLQTTAGQALKVGNPAVIGADGFAYLDATQKRPVAIGRAAFTTSAHSVLSVHNGTGLQIEFIAGETLFTGAEVFLAEDGRIYRR